MAQDRLSPPPRPIQRESPGRGNDEFTLRLFDRLRSAEGNVWFSPLGVRAALALSLAGAHGETARQIQEVLGLPGLDGSTLPALVRPIETGASSPGRGSGATIASSIWTQAGAQLLPEFIERIALLGAGESFTADFMQDAEAARGRINRWAAERTHDRIREPLRAGELEALTRMVVVNAVHFKSTWMHQFKPQNTAQEPFHLEDGGTVSVPLMHRVKPAGYARAKDVQVAHLAFMDGDWSMLVLLPEERNGLPALEESLTAERLTDLVDLIRPQVVDLHLPRFTIREYSVDLVAHLRALGMLDAFDRERADFSGINGRTPPDPGTLFIGKVRQQAMLEVNEEGAEAAAVTTSRMMLGMSRSPRELEPVVMRVDHPFLVAIRNRRTHELLFFGRVVNPPQ